MKHKHYECIVAFAEGKKIQYKLPSDIQWFDCHNTPVWYLDTEYRIKPEPQEQEPQYLYVYRHIDTSKTKMCTTFIQETYGWVYMGKVRLEK